MLLGRCEFAKDDYSLNIINLPTIEDDEYEEDECDAPEVDDDCLDGEIKTTLF